MSFDAEVRYTKALQVTQHIWHDAQGTFVEILLKLILV